MDQKQTIWQEKHVNLATNLLFAVTLILLLALSSWWFVLHWKQIQTVDRFRQEQLDSQAEMLSVRLGYHRGKPKLPENSHFELIESNNDKSAFTLNPNWPNVAIRPRAEVIQAREKKHRRQMTMILGEGSLLMIMLVVCFFMLYRLLLAERKSRKDMEVFFQAVSHELKTPLAGVRALLETLSSRDINRDDMVRYAALGLRETTRLQSLIENVLFANRIDRHIFRPRPRAIDVVDVIEQFLARRNKIFTKQQAEFKKDCDKNVQVFADPDLLRNVLENLIGNAFKYSGNDPQVSVELQKCDAQCCIRVHDNGIGLSQEDADQVFDKFYRKGNTSAKGSGLGLFISRTLVKSFDGDLTVESPGEGEGSTFSIKLRLAEENQETDG